MGKRKKYWRAECQQAENVQALDIQSEHGMAHIMRR